ncbi:tyrosine-type recombinase/integrase [Bythopirellula goksoeyrii]|uniref:tyrosine-type recombinase/integrase n=1 Tax=Bythopirellula goksoeyrii TaxID=1400387 RepID=UPI0011CDAFB0
MHMFTFPGGNQGDFCDAPSLPARTARCNKRIVPTTQTLGSSPRGSARQTLLVTDRTSLRGHGVHRVMAGIMYGFGMRLMECCRLRAKDIDIDRGQFLLREAKGDKDRAVPLPEKLRPALLQFRLSSLDSQPSTFPKWHKISCRNWPL